MSSWKIQHTYDSFSMELSEKSENIEQILRLFKHALNAAGYTWVADLAIINQYGRLTTAYETEDYWMNQLERKGE